MKKLLNISLVFVFVFFSVLSGKISYRLAKQKDLEKILSLYDNFSDDDKSKLVVFPDIELQKNIILENIKNKRLFVAQDSDSKKIISFLKLFIINNNQELNEIVDQELNLTEALKPFKQKKCIYFYYGSAYTVLEFRKQGISTKLLNFAFNYLYKNHVERFLNKEHLILLYGQVKANFDNKYIEKAFKEFIANGFYNKYIEIYSYELATSCYIKSEVKHIPLNDIELTHFYNTAYKPELILDTNTNELSVNIIKDKEHEGRGNMLVYHIIKN